MNSIFDKEFDAMVVYAFMWRVLHLAVHRYGAPPTGEMLTVMITMLLDEVGYHPTVSEVAELADLPKSTVSRYVSAEMDAGFLLEDIDPHDRRRRRLRCTPAAIAERHQHFGEVIAMQESLGELFGPEGADHDAAAVMAQLQRFTEQERAAERGSELTAATSAGPHPLVGKTYALIWRLLDLSVHSYGSMPAGELLVIFTLVIADFVHYQPTISEVARIVGLPKSTVSRYCSTHITTGFLEEVIDPADRRRRLLRVNPARAEEREQYRQHVRSIWRKCDRLVSELPPPAATSKADLMREMRAIAGDRPPPSASRA
ncbi:MAG: helix-turn-helix domain-containing protein [Gammaproteobacteria bacterium]|nr:helix-turn-helix domain-containing protein [Gammaproteobacteria bacterium]